MGISASCYSDKPLGPNLSVIRHVCDVTGDIPSEIRKKLGARCIDHELTDCVRESAHQRDPICLSRSPGESAPTAWVAIERCTPMIHRKSIPSGDLATTK